ncbi:anthranilate synthase [Lyngbya sp. PCC 8106]|uniref:anthranilate synthase n=1 Tax=Lyngbya sp. (strain PCC 8106) TaxID=313612 RepID=UPI0000EAD18D|nr:anthranilate synthase [Lyngbya sp. PCC 8106]EAW38199.1 Glutamine amidotransferase of anthranilate synthase [Lyngbya sp. PCC 8106]
MTYKPQQYLTDGGIEIFRQVELLPMETALDRILPKLDTVRGGLLTSSYEYPGRYRRWAIGFVNPPLEIATRDHCFTITALNERGEILIKQISSALYDCTDLKNIQHNRQKITGTVASAHRLFSEEERSQQPSAFSVIRAITNTFKSDEDEHLGLYGALGYDLVFQFEPIPQKIKRPDDQQDLVLYLPDELIVVDYYLQQAFQLQYDFKTANSSTDGLPRTGEVIDYRGKRQPLTQVADHAEGEYADLVKTAFDYFRRGDLFEVVPSQSFFESCETNPCELFQTLQTINPSPYGFIFNLGGEYLIGASPEMFVRVDGRRVETCPISGTIERGDDAIEDATQIRHLLNSLKDETELTMCTDVDRNDKSRVCKPGSVQVIGRRQVEMYSHLIHTVDHVEGVLEDQYDALDAFLTHTWAVTVTGAPKRAAIAFIEQHERSARRWYGGAVGYFNFNGNLNTGLVLRTIRLKDSVAEVRVGATVLHSSIPEAEAKETLTKAAAMLQALKQTQRDKLSPSELISPAQTTQRRRPKVLIVDYEDSFVHTLANYIRYCGAEVVTRRHGFPLEVLDQEQPNLVVLSPGPGCPADFGVSNMVNACVERHIPLFGVCLGLQGIVEAFGGTLGVLDCPQHGISSQITVVDSDSVLFKDLPSTFEAGRYHSLHALTQAIPAQLKVTAFSSDQVIMAIEHRDLPITAVQFHPESLMTMTGSAGLKMIQNVVDAYGSISGDGETTQVENSREEVENSFIEAFVR